MADLLDRRQRLAAVLLLSASDQPATTFAMQNHLAEVFELCPDLAADEVPLWDRPACLGRARDLIDTMLAEIG